MEPRLDIQTKYWGSFLSICIPKKDYPCIKFSRLYSLSLSDRLPRCEKHYGVAGFAYEWNGKNSGENTILKNVFIPALSAATFEWMITFDTDNWAKTNGCRNANDRTLNLTENCKNKFVNEITYICNNYAKHAKYATVNGKPMELMR